MTITHDTCQRDGAQPSQQTACPAELHLPQEHGVCGIYCLTHRESGRRYVGQSVDIHRRIRHYCSGNGHRAIGAAIREYGWGAFDWYILERCDRSELNACERFWVDCAQGFTLGFNLTDGGAQGLEVSESTRAKLREAHTGRKKDAQHVARVAAALAELRGTEAFKTAVSAGVKKAWQDPSRAEKATKALKGRSLDPEWRAKIATTLTGRKQSPETVARRAESARRTFALRRQEKQS